MRLPASKIESATAIKDVRYYLNSVHLDVEKRRLLASDGLIVAVVPVEVEDGDVSGPVTVDAIKAARRGKSGIKCGAALVFDDGASMPRPETVLYPRVDNSIPPSVDDQLTIYIDAKLLYNLALALCGGKKSAVRLYIPAGGAPTTVIRVESRDGGYGAMAQLSDNKDWA